MRLLPGDPERLGDYWLASRLATGGQAIVYEAYDERGRRYAIKTFRRGAPERLAETREVTSHRTARVVEARPDATPPRLVSEFVAGPDLRQAVERQGPYRGDRLARLAAALATALLALHQAGVVHRDLKPENVLLGPTGPQVIDFGVAGPGRGFVAGVPAYLAPETFTGAPADPAGDVFAWGAVILFAATGTDPFLAESLGGVLHRLLTLDPDLGALPEPLRGLVARALAKDPAARPAAPELLDGLPDRSRCADLAPSCPPSVQPLGEWAEDLYRALSPAHQAALPGLLLRMLDEYGVRPLPAAEIDDPGLVARLTEQGLLVRRSVPVPPTETATGRLVAVGDGSVAPVCAALFHAWPRLRRWSAGAFRCRPPEPAEVERPIVATISARTFDLTEQVADQPIFPRDSPD